MKIWETIFEIWEHQCLFFYVYITEIYLTNNWRFIELYNNKSHGLSPPGGFSSHFFDQVVPYYSQRHLADWNAIYILHWLDCARPHVEGSGVSR